MKSSSTKPNLNTLMPQNFKVLGRNESTDQKNNGVILVKRSMYKNKFQRSSEYNVYNIMYK